MQALIPLFLEATIHYGPEFVSSVIALMKKETVTLDEVEALFANVKPYTSYHIQPPGMLPSEPPK